MPDSQIKIHQHELENKSTFESVMARLTPEQVNACVVLAGTSTQYAREVIQRETNLQLKLKMQRDLELSVVCVASDFALACVLKQLNVFRLQFAGPLDVWHNYLELQRCVNRIDCTISDDVNLRHVD